ncbi:CAAX protease [Erwiniaceae bacterium BAC15a-03b]|uniref:CAAX protease n=1 Tax=Winslowiella arboricola TaxID=2978220 RepID=A0A9J6PQC8_9GAMM|nr:CAAX protease [Winslowiella arboricola]MCU5775508.1 CAAX protease [Winslowiella arboricola]MCU5779642.1 CAAX protease [Winslowiella arboricola]
MPKSINYPPVMSLLSTARLASVPVIFDLHSDIEKYGFSIWLQHAAAALYPLVQQLELVLRNSIDNAARSRFGDYWWDKILYDKTKENADNFIGNINKAKNKLKKRWKRSERIQPGLTNSVRIKAPAFTHDDIVASADLHTWEAILVDAYNTDIKNLKSEFLWPLSLSKTFRRLDVINNNPTKARKEIINLINELREYRNRLFHHDCIWIKSKSVDTRTAIDSIREKINLIEKVLFAISPSTVSALSKWGIFAHARRVCSVQELNIYTNLNYTVPSTNELPVFDRYLGMTDGTRHSVPLMVNKTACIFYQMR